MAKLTQALIAEKLDISQSSVSLTLANPATKRVAKGTKEKIFTFIKENDPSFLVGKNISGSICYLSQKTHEVNKSGLFARLLTGAEAEARDSGLDLVFKLWETQDDLKNIFENGDFSGIICCGGKSEKDIRYLQQFSPVVVLNDIIDPLICSMVSIDNHGGIRMAVKHCYEMGHRNIAYAHLSQYCALGHSLERLGGYYEAHHMLGLTVSNEFIFHPDGLVDKDFHKKAIRKIMDMPDRPTAIICFNDWLAIALMKEALKEGLKLPEDLSFIGFDNSEIGRDWLPALTTVHQKREDMGRAAVALLCRKIKEGKEVIPEKVLCEAGLIIRDSVAKI